MESKICLRNGFVIKGRAYEVDISQKILVLVPGIIDSRNISDEPSFNKPWSSGSIA